MTKYLFNSFSNDKKFDFNSISEAIVMGKAKELIDNRNFKTHLFKNNMYSFFYYCKDILVTHDITDDSLENLNNIFKCIANILYSIKIHKYDFDDIIVNDLILDFVPANLYYKYVNYLDFPIDYYYLYSSNSYDILNNLTSYIFKNFYIFVYNLLLQVNNYFIENY